MRLTIPLPSGPELRLNVMRYPNEFIGSVILTVAFEASDEEECREKGIASMARTLRDVLTDLEAIA